MMKTLPQIKCLKCEFYKGLNQDYSKNNGEDGKIVEDGKIHVWCTGLNGEKESVMVNDASDCSLFIGKGKTISIIHQRNINYRSVY